jgi:hypothetical protein
MEATQATDDIQQAVAHTPEPWFIDALADNETQLWIRTLHYPITSIPFGKAPDTDKANARRIVAAVNACKGLSTEALERGVIADLRPVLGELLTAAGDLDAAIDGATTEFDDERNRLNLALRAAQAVLDSSRELDRHEQPAAALLPGTDSETAAKEEPS